MYILILIARIILICYLVMQRQPFLFLYWQGWERESKRDAVFHQVRSQMFFMGNSANKTLLLGEIAVG